MHSIDDAVVLCGKFEKWSPDGVKVAALHVLRQNSETGTVKKPPSDLGLFNAALVVRILSPAEHCLLMFRSG
jgi:hypothetical protein